MMLNPEAVARREQIPSVAPHISIEERRRRISNPIDYRRLVYRQGIWAASLPDAFGRFRESSADYYRYSLKEYFANNSSTLNLIFIFKKLKPKD